MSEIFQIEFFRKVYEEFERNIFRKNLIIKWVIMGIKFKIYRINDHIFQSQFLVPRETIRGRCSVPVFSTIHETVMKWPTQSVNLSVLADGLGWK